MFHLRTRLVFCFCFSIKRKVLLCYAINFRKVFVSKISNGKYKFAFKSGVQHILASVNLFAAKFSKKKKNGKIPFLINF